MAQKLQIGDTVYVACARFEELTQNPVALYETTVAAIANRKVQVNLPDGEISDWIGKGLTHKDVGILIITIGELETETTLLDPLAKSVLQFCRLLVPDDQLKAIKLRSLAELNSVWKREQAAYSHIILIAHGKEDGIRFGVDDWVDATKFGESLRLWGAASKVFISLCCQTGYKEFGGTFSEQAICRSLIVPFQSVHSAVASQFCQSLLASHFIEGKTIGVAFKRARKSVTGSTSFRLWKSGKLKTK